MRKPVAAVLAAALALALAGCGQRPADPGTSAGDVTPSSVPAIPTPVSPTAQEAPVKLGPQAQDALDRARAEGARTVAVTVSTEPGQVERAVAGLRGLGATVESSDASVGYVRATVPVDEVARVPGVEGVRQVDVDEPLSNGDPAP